MILFLFRKMQSILNTLRIILIANMSALNCPQRSKFKIVCFFLFLKQLEYIIFSLSRQFIVNLDSAELLRNMKALYTIVPNLRCFSNESNPFLSETKSLTLSDTYIRHRAKAPQNLLISFLFVQKNFAENLKGCQPHH